MGKVVLTHLNLQDLELILRALADAISVVHYHWSKFRLVSDGNFTSAIKGLSREGPRWDISLVFPSSSLGL